MITNFNKVPRYVLDEISQDGTIAADQKSGRVQRVQEWLSFHGFPVQVDGEFGPATEESVRRFQDNRRLAVTGEVDKATWDALVAPMRRALEAPPDIDGMTPAEAVRTVARKHLGEHPVEIGGDNRGPWVRLYCQGNDGPDFAWCAGFVSTVMQQAYFYLDKTPPIKGSLSCDLLATQGQKAGLFVDGPALVGGRADLSRLEPCAIFLKRRESDDWVHTGFCVGVHGSGEKAVFDTIEGNTNSGGSREGFEATARVRGMSGAGYDFICFS